MGLLTEEELLEFERLCDAEGFSADTRLKIVRDVFGKTEARLYEERRCKVVTFAARENHLEDQGSRSRQTAASKVRQARPDDHDASLEEAGAGPCRTH